MLSSVPLEASSRLIFPTDCSAAVAPATVAAGFGRETAVGQRRVGMAAVRRGADIGAHGHMRGDGVETRLVDAAADRRMPRHQLAVAVAPLPGVLVDAVVVVAIFGHAVDEPLAQHFLVGIVALQRVEQLPRAQPTLVEHGLAHCRQAIGHVGDLHPLHAGEVVMGAAGCDIQDRAPHSPG